PDASWRTTGARWSCCLRARGRERASGSCSRCSRDNRGRAVTGRGPVRWGVVIRRLCVAALSVAALSCRSPDPQAVLETSDLEAYWAIDPPVGDTRYIAPAARFRVKNKGTEMLRSVQATATFRRKGEVQTW